MLPAASASSICKHLFVGRPLLAAPYFPFEKTQLSLNMHEVICNGKTKHVWITIAGRL